VVARTAEAHAALVAQMAAHEPERLYVALVWGHPKTDEGTIDAPIGRSARHPTRMTVTDRGRPAVTHYVVRDRFDHPRPVALLECRLETGRTHQIRVHLRAIGHPIVGDRDYDGGRPGLDPGRPFLHASRLTFRHPVTGEPISVEAPLPADLEATLAECR
jgi:23S rRNA pseudouridine1911/1915/1917 synthase